MADPVETPTTWSKEYHTYLEKHNVYDVLQELMKELVIWKPEDPLEYLAEEIDHVVKSIHSPRVFMVGLFPEILEIGKRIAEASGARFLTVDDIINSSLAEIKAQLSGFLGGKDVDNEELRKLLIDTIGTRVEEVDCLDGYILCGFPQTKVLATMAQQNGLLPRQVLALFPPGSRNETHKEKSPNGGTQMAATDIKDHKNYKAIRDVAATFNLDICTAMSYDRWMKMSRAALESELMGALITKKPTGAPWIPRVLLLGPPGSGKSSVADHLATRFQIVNADWLDMVRGAALWVDEVAQEAQQYLIDLKPMSESSVEKIIERKLGRDDCQKKGWVLQGFPESPRHCKLLERLSYCPSRIFILSCPDEICAMRMLRKQQAILKRQLPGLTPQPKLQLNKELNIGDFPYSEYAVKFRCELYNSKIEQISTFYDNPINVDATKNLDTVRAFVEAALLRPPTNKFSKVFNE